MKFNHKIVSLEPSKSVSLMSKVKEMQKTDADVINVTGGDPDFPTPKPICEEVYRQLESGNTHYVDGQGDLELREAISEKLRRENHAVYSKEQILITPGGKYAVYVSVSALLNEGDEVLWLAPGWVSYPSIIESVGGIPVVVPLSYESQYQLDYEQLENLTTDRTKLLIINYPNNPTGKILIEEDLQVLHRYLKNHPDVWVLSDEIYEKIIYDNHEYKSISAYPDVVERCIVINGFSKCSAMTGWRIGYLACPTELMGTIMKLFAHTMSCTSGFVQKAAITALSCKEETDKMRAEYQQRRDFLIPAINEIAGLHCRIPEGAFYAWVLFDLPYTGEKIAAELLEEVKVGAVPGDAYGEIKPCIRFSFAASMEELRKLVERLRIYMQKKADD